MVSVWWPQAAPSHPPFGVRERGPLFPPVPPAGGRAVLGSLACLPESSIRTMAHLKAERVFMCVNKLMHSSLTQMPAMDTCTQNAHGMAGPGRQREPHACAVEGSEPEGWAGSSPRRHLGAL